MFRYGSFSHLDLDLNEKLQCVWLTVCWGCMINHIKIETWVHTSMQSHSNTTVVLYLHWQDD